MAETRIAVTVTHADGNVTRWGADEADPADVPYGITFGSSVPGGFKTATVTLPRRIDREYPDLNLYDDIRFYIPGGETVWEGRIAQLPLQHDTSFAVNVGAIGWSAHLTDDSSFSMIYVDRDLSGWGDMSAPRRLNLASVPWTFGAFSVMPDTTTGLPALVTTMTADWANQAIVESYYDAGPGNLIGSIYYSFTAGAITNPADTNWEWSLQVTPDDVPSGALGTGNLRAASGSAYFTPASQYRYGMVQHFYLAAVSGQANNAFDVLWKTLAVYGSHGLTRRGTDPGGFYASDVLPDILDRAAPLLNYTTGDGGSITSTSFAIPHLVFRDAGTAEDAITLINGYHLFEWGVWEDRQFFFREPDPDRLTWQARLSDGARVSLEGDDANNIYNGVVVQYQDPAGKQHTVGPPGSGQEATDASLVDTSATNPINAHGIARRWAILNISQTTTQAAAIQIGGVWLAEHSQPQHRGTITLTGSSLHPTKGSRPVVEIRAGDWITIADRPGDVARRIIEVSYDHDQRTATLSIDNTTFKLDAILERLGASIVGVI